MSQTTEPTFKPHGTGPKGVGGWLAFFIIGQMVLRPLRMLGEMMDPQNAITTLFKAQFPTAATIISIENAINIGLLLFGIVVAVTLWKVRTPFSVKLTKIYLIVNAAAFILDAFVYKFSDLPPQVQDSISEKALIGAAPATIVFLIWFLYFVRSKRVRATYYEDVSSLGLP